MATIDQLKKAAVEADRRGEEGDVRALMAEIERRTSSSKETAAEPAEKPRATKMGAARTLAQGITLGFGDEAEAYVRSTFSGRDRDEILAEVRKNISQFKQAKPVLAAGLEMGGAVVSSLVPAGLAVKGGLAAAKGAGIAKAGLRGAGIGAAEGGVAGFGVGEGGLENRLQSAATGAALGGVLGGVLPVAGAVGGDVLRRAADGLGVGGQQRAATVAERRVGKALSDEGLTPEAALAKVGEAQSLGAPMMLADIGPATRGAAYASQAVPSSQRAGVLDVVSERAVSQGGRIADVTADSMDASGAYGADYLDELYEKSAEKFRPLYQAADKPIDAAPFRKYANRKVFKDAFSAIQQRADTLGEKTLPDLETALSGDQVPTLYLQDIAQGLDRVINSNTSKIEGPSDFAKDVMTVRNEFKAAIGELNDAYKKADAQFADYSDLTRAFKVGDDFEKLSSQDFARKVAKMTPTEVDALKTGMITKIRNIASGTDRTDYVQRLFGSPRRRDALEKAFPSAEEFSNFRKYMEAETSIAATKKRVYGTSGTVENLQEMSEQGIDPLSILQLFTGGTGEAIRQVGNNLGARAQGVGGPVAAEMSDLLFSQGAKAQSQAVGRVTARQAQDELLRRRLRSQPELYGGILGATAGLNQDDLGY